MEDSTMIRDWLDAGIHKVEVEGGTADSSKSKISIWDLSDVASYADEVARKFFKEEMGYAPEEDEDLRVVCIPLKLRKSRHSGRNFVTFRVLITWEDQ
jgi:hypothetical protein